MSLYERLTLACKKQDWDAAKALIDQYPGILLNTGEDRFGTPAIHAAFWGNVSMLEFMLNSVRAQLQEFPDAMFRVFEAGTSSGHTPAHEAALAGETWCLEFLIKHCPSGPAILEKRSSRGETPGGWALRNGHISTLEFILKHSPSGKIPSVLHERYLDLIKNTRAYFTTERLNKIGWSRELRLLRVSRSLGSFVDLVLGIVSSEIKIRMK